jgi:hypothetical protein
VCAHAASLPSPLVRSQPRHTQPAYGSTPGMLCERIRDGRQAASLPSALICSHTHTAVREHTGAGGSRALARRSDMRSSDFFEPTSCVSSCRGAQATLSARPPGPTCNSTPPHNKAMQARSSGGGGPNLADVLQAAVGPRPRGGVHGEEGALLVARQAGPAASCVLGTGPRGRPCAVLLTGIALSRGPIDRLPCVDYHPKGSIDGHRTQVPIAIHRLSSTMRRV